MKTTNQAWNELIYSILKHGIDQTCRGMKTKELIARKSQFYMRDCVLTHPGRTGINYQFMREEGLWMVRGDNSLAPLTKWVKRMADFSDDGETLYGAYGPRFNAQCPYILDTLCNDPGSRQAYAIFGERNPPKTKDLPCTISMQFMIRNNYLNTCVSMRSSDAWLGLPYDIFSFSMMSMKILLLLKAGDPQTFMKTDLGVLNLFAGSCHIYEQHIDAAIKAAMMPEKEIENRLTSLRPRDFQDYTHFTVWLDRKANQTPSLNQLGTNKQFWEK